MRVLERRHVKVDDPLAVTTAAAKGNPWTSASWKLDVTRVVAVAFDGNAFVRRIQHQNRDAVDGDQRGNVDLVDIDHRAVYAVASREPADLL